MHPEPLQTSTGFYPRFIFLRIRSSGFGLPWCDFRHFHTAHLIACVRVAFAAGPTMIVLPLPHPRHSLAHYSQRTLAHRNALEDYPYMVSGSLNSLSRVLFNFPSRYWYAIGLSTCLRLEVDASQLPTPFPRDGTQDTLSSLSVLTTGLSPSLARRSRRLCLTERRLNEGPKTPHALHLSVQDSVCRVRFSVALTYRIPIGFSSCGY
jgi:hypothetical protein